MDNFLNTEQSMSERLWKVLTNPWVLTIATLFVLFFMLGAKEIWTQEWRWANICHQMLLRHDFFHPYLAGRDYYDKPLLSYWTIIAFSYVTGSFNIWAIRLPNAIAGLIVVFTTFYLGKKLSSRRTAYLAAWMLISSFMFIYWSRVASADMLNVAGIMVALSWYFAKKENPNFLNYLIFFVIVAIACLFKGIVAAAITFLVLIPELLKNGNWKDHLNFSFILALCIGTVLYLSPFILSSYINPVHYQESGLFEVFRENFIRYVHPYDNFGPIYTYLLFLPLYIFPWILFFIPALGTLPRRWKSMTAESRWMVWAIILVFLFFTFSGSRRNYYVLPMIPFAILVTADWVAASSLKSLRQLFAKYTIIVFYLITTFVFCILYPVAYSGGGIPQFAHTVRQQATKIQPWNQWHIVMLDAKTKTSFYLQSPNLITFMNAIGNIKNKPNTEGLYKSFPILKAPRRNNILIIRKSYLPYLELVLKQYQIIMMQRNVGDRLMNRMDPTAPVALIPKQSPYGANR